MPLPNARGLVDKPVVYFENRDGRLILAVSDDHPCPQGFERKEARSLPEIDQLHKRFQTKDRAEWDSLCDKDRAVMQVYRDRNRSRLTQRLMAIDCGPMERALIKSAFAYYAKKEKELYEATVNGYFHAREYDSTSPDPATTGEHDAQLPKSPLPSARLQSSLKIPDNPFVRKG